MSLNTALVLRSISDSTSEDSCSTLLCRAPPGAACLIGQSDVDFGLSAGAFNMAKDNRRRMTCLIDSMRAVAVSNDTGKHSILGPTKSKRDI